MIGLAKPYTRQYFERRLKTLENERNKYLPLWRDCRDMFLPVAGSFDECNNKNEAENKLKNYRNLMNSIGIFAVERLSAGMMSGLTSPVRSWFRLTTDNSDLKDVKVVQNWFYNVENVIRSIFLKSNVYRTLSQVYSESSVFGQAVFAVVEDNESVIRCIPFTCGEYCLSSTKGEQIDTIYRQLHLTVAEVISNFGLDNVSRPIALKYKEGRLSDDVVIIHAVEPNRLYTKTRITDKPFISVYFEKNNKEKPFLSISGFNHLPVIAPRWDIIANSWYGNAPANRCLSDALMLQKMQTDKIKMVELAADPPKIAPTSMQDLEVAYIPGATYYSDSPTNVIRPLSEAKANINELENLILQCEQRIEKGFYNDLFLMIVQITKNMTATEVDERKEEKFLMLGSVVDRLQNELLKPLIDITFEIAYSKGLIPEPPDILQGTDLKIEYISLLAQAQKITQTGSITSFLQFVASLSQLAPEAVDKIDIDQSIDDYADFIGTPPSLVRSDEDVAEIRQARQLAQEEQANQLKQQQTIDQAEQLSKIEMQKETGLTKLMDNLGIL